MRTLVVLLLVALLGGGALLATGQFGKVELPDAITTTKSSEPPKQVYQCTKAGSVVFSDKPCGENEQRITIRKTTVMDNSALREQAKKQAEAEKGETTGPSLHVIPDSTKQPIGSNDSADQDCGSSQSTDAGSHNPDCSNHQDWKSTVTDTLKGLVK